MAKKSKFKIPLCVKTGRLISRPPAATQEECEMHLHRWKETQNDGYEKQKLPSSYTEESWNEWIADRIKYYSDINWVENFEFEETFEIYDMYTMNSSAKFRLRSTTQENNTVEMSSSNLFKMLQKASVHRGVVSGTWTYAKNGPVYSVKFVKPPAQEMLF